MCDSCLAQQGANCDEFMNYKNFFERGWEYTTISHEAYVALDTKISDWACIPGWRVETVMYDFMHNVYLGTARDLVASAVRSLLSADWFESLDAVQNDMIQRCKENGFFAGTSIGLLWLCSPKLCPKMSKTISFLIFPQYSCRLYLPRKPVLTEASLGGTQDYAELSKRYKASHIKTLVWWCPMTTQRCADSRPDVP